MTQGFKATLFAGVITFGVMAPAFAAAPIITDIPDVTIGDLDSSVANEFVYEADFSLNDFVDYDGDKADLLWSFGESDSDGLETNEYTINGVGALVSGDANLSTEVTSATVTVNPATPVPVTPTTTFRDIVLSPASEEGPFADPTTEQAATAAAGKVITYFVSDGENVDSDLAVIRTVDNAADVVSSSDGWNVEYNDSDFDSAGWVPSGISSTGVTIDQEAGKLTITVTPTTGVGRVYGWQNPSILSYDDVGASKFVRAKFYISASNAMDAAINEVPNFRLRVTNTAAVDAAAHFEYAQTAFASPSHEPRYNNAANPTVEQFSKWLRPSNDEATPSLYRVDFDPVDVEAANGTPIGALMESYSYNDTANGTLALHEVVLGTYNALTDEAGELIFDYDAKGEGLDGGAGDEKQISGGAFDAEANFEPGRRQILYVQGVDTPPSGGYAFNAQIPGIGLVASTRFVSTDLFGMDLLNVQSINDEDKPRLEAGKLYKAKFYAQGILPGTAPEDQVVQGPMRFRFQTAGGTLSYLYELLGAAGLGKLSDDGKADLLAETAGPSTNSQNPETDSQYAVNALGVQADGGWYSLVVSSPLNEDGIRQDTEDFGDLGDEPGPGVAEASNRDILLGVDLIQAPTALVISAGGAPVPFNQPNHSEVGISAVKLYQYSDINDGGYDFDGN